MVINCSLGSTIHSSFIDNWVTIDYNSNISNSKHLRSCCSFNLDFENYCSFILPGFIAGSHFINYQAFAYSQSYHLPNHLNPFHQVNAQNHSFQEYNQLDLIYNAIRIYLNSHKSPTK